MNKPLRSLSLQYFPWQYLSLLLACGLLAALYLTYPRWLAPLGHYLVVRDPLVSADAVLPLAGDARRPGYAADLLTQGYAKWFLITPLPLETRAARERYVDHVRRVAMRRGVPAEAILVVPETGKTTYQEARNVERFMKEKGLESLLIVTTPWHTRRSRIIFQEVLGDNFSIQPLRDDDYAHRGHIYRPEAWWTYELGRDPTISEYLKLIAHWLGVR